MVGTTDRTPGLLRRLAAIGYDLLLLAAVEFVFTLGTVALRGGRAVGPGSGWFTLSLAGIAVLFFTWFWTHGGQTLGMRAWRLRLVRRDGGPVRLPRALTRCLAAVLSALPAGLGFWWAWVDPEQLCWHDRLSDTKLVLTARHRAVSAAA